MTESPSWRDHWARLGAAFGHAPARWLCEVASGCDGDELLTVLDEVPTERMVTHLEAMAGRVRRGEPLQYALGRWGFRHLDVLVDRRVLIPRAETEAVVEVALACVGRGAPPRRCADLGCGSGVIGLSLAAELPVEGTEVWLTDASADALDVARANAAGLGRAAANVRIAQGWWFDALPEELAGTFDLIVSNPPYVAEGSEAIEPIVVEHEPHVALFAGVDGLDALRVLIGEGQRWLRHGGWLVCEIGADQGTPVAALAASAGWAEVEVRPDLAGRDRILLARRS